MHFPIKSAAVFEFSMIGVKVKTGVTEWAFEDSFELNDGFFDDGFFNDLFFNDGFFNDGVFNDGFFKFSGEFDDSCEIDCEVCNELIFEEKMAFEELFEWFRLPECEVWSGVEVVCCKAVLVWLFFELVDEICLLDPFVFEFTFLKFFVKFWLFSVGIVSSKSVCGAYVAFPPRLRPFDPGHIYNR